MAKPNLFFGAKASNVLVQDDSGWTDNGVTYTLRACTDRFAPAGASGESAFYALYFPVTHDAAVTLLVTPLLDGVPLDAQTIVLPTPGARHVAMLEVDLRISFPVTIANYATLGKFAPRGTWLQVQVDTVGAALGYVALGGVEVEHETLRDTLQPGVNK